ncbi:hypothetical protein T492DRAFT_932919 [Pavlovales sp. CCMP2436]|nr:hypothetical protein T492DRAFT_932919 [Pavlovales sp. CCMP2436]|mmetsp:Transcript_3228/g.8000  ORF Transcript_3228/g.8000 Transcript_3228/m.8000 type:complete len:271 (+) Transcript_3228:1305-2117(+)
MMKLFTLLALFVYGSEALRTVASPRVLKPFAERRALKVISGLMNFDQVSVAMVCQAAGAGGASLVDIACDPALVKLARSVCDLPICVSSVEPELFVAAVAAGAEMVEIGNYDAFYLKGITFSAAQVEELTRRTRELLPDTPLSVTIPHTLPIDQQVALAEALLAYGVDVIQTEGGMGAKPFSAGVLGMIEKAAPSLAAAHEISRCIGGRAHVMAASGISDVTAPLALAAGADGVGVGSAINKLGDVTQMSFAVRRIADAMAIAQRARVSA